MNSQFNQIKITKRIPCLCREDCNFLFDYETLLKAERKGRKTLMCLTSLDDVSLKNYWMELIPP